MLRLDRGTADVVATVRRYAPIADEIGADGIDVDAGRADLLLSSTLVAAGEERAMHAMAGRLLRRFGWAEGDFAYHRNVRYAETCVAPSGPPAVRLVIDRAGQELGWEGAVHGTGLGPGRSLDIEPARDDLVARLFVTVPAATITGGAAALEPWLARVDPAAVSVDRGRAALLYRARAGLTAEAERLGLDVVGAGRIEGGAGHVIETATAADGTVLWLRRGADPVSRHWPGIIETRAMVIDASYPD
ncbi:hypothetical protein Aph02nite_90100 [Actinoplanes philippinensis]|nr:hypothetical protein Aph02nite_90100 [Actinoplanes philippinensis]